MLNSKELDKLSEIYDYFDHNGDGALVSKPWVKLFSYWINVQSIDELIDSVNDYMDKYPSRQGDQTTDRERIISGKF